MLDNMATTKMALSSGPRVFEAREHSQDSLIATPIAVRERAVRPWSVCGRRSRADAVQWDESVHLQSELSCSTSYTTHTVEVLMPMTVNHSTADGTADGTAYR